MSAPTHGLRSLADQRYYHFLALQDDHGLTVGGVWKKLHDVQNGDDTVDFKDTGFVIQRKKLKSRRAYARGTIADTLSERGDGKPPYFYDVVVVRADFAGNSFLMIGFPFAGLALDTMRTLVEEQGLLKLGHFVGADVPTLVVNMEKGFRPAYNDLRSHVVGVQFVVKHDKNLTAVKLGGDDPLSAEIYVNYLRRKVTSKDISPDQCILACEREWELGRLGAGEVRTFRSRIHFDTYGNFRFYAHIGCANLRILPVVLGQLHRANLLHKVLANPLQRLDLEGAQ
jgi:hypothetical protein